MYRALIYCCGRYQRADRAQAVFEEMQGAGIEPSMASWSALLNAYAETRQPHKAAEVIHAMRRRGLVPSVQVRAAGALG